MKKEVLRKLYPTLTDAELEIAEENLRRYLLLAWDIWQSHQSTLTEAEPSFTIKAKVDSPTQTNPPNL